MKSRWLSANTFLWFLVLSPNIVLLLQPFYIPVGAFLPENGKYKNKSRLRLSVPVEELIQFWRLFVVSKLIHHG